MSYGDRYDSKGWTAYIGAAGIAKFIIDDGTTQVVLEDAADHTDDNYHAYAACMDRDGNGVIYIDGDHVTDVNDYAIEGKIISNASIADVVSATYSSSTGKTTVVAIPYTETWWSPTEASGLWNFERKPSSNTGLTTNEVG